MSSKDSQENIRRFVRFTDGILKTLQMLEEGIISDINIRVSSWYDGTALMYQAAYGTVEAMEYLLAHKPPALINLKNRNEKTALQCLVWSGLLSTLIKTRYGWTALHCAVWGGDDPAKVRLLLDYGADKTIWDDDGETALDVARKNNRTECIKVLESYTPKPRG